MNEDDVRRIVREEIVKAMKTLAAEAEDCDVAYETDEILSTALGAVAQAAEKAARTVAGKDACCDWCGDVLPDHKYWCGRRGA